jgi:hypothetical protein
MGFLATCLCSVDIIIFQLKTQRDCLAGKYLLDKSLPPIFLSQSCTEEFSRSFYNGVNQGEFRDLRPFNVVSDRALTAFEIIADHAWVLGPTWCEEYRTSLCQPWPFLFYV